MRKKGDREKMGKGKNGEGSEVGRGERGGRTRREGEGAGERKSGLHGEKGRSKDERG